ncbi:MAG: hypothetical protein ALECFALPRED_006862 [Alectoria fallacina]|uniref:S-adenosyl-L-methionine-dependent methyltransferase n=1 Tax=Alectoria fallacina TaxID=1903189 RepID=A0A8H3IQD4_9LECA|nr:MAG: hypothetical protein ALECFALPRED_006862 [Alectoria fallacina]
MAPPAPQRSFHTTDTEYNLPNDSPEHARLEEQAAGYAELMHNRVIHAPLSHPQRLLDIGCGTGAVTHHLGTTYPAADRIYGIDLSPVPNINRPGESPGNISFIQGDVRKLSKTDQRLAPGSFDYVFSRLLICGMTDWAGYMRDTVAPLLKPGGWVEVQDLDYVWYKHGHVCSGEWKWLRAINEGAKRKGMDLSCGSNAAKYMREAGLVDVSVKRYGAPFGTWAVKQRPESERIGAAQAEGIGPLYEVIVPRLAQGLGLSESEVQGLVGESSECLRAEDGKEWVVHVTVGRRPF